MAWDDYYDCEDQTVICSLCDSVIDVAMLSDLKNFGWFSIPPQQSLSGTWENLCPKCIHQYRKELNEKAADHFTPIFDTI